LVNLLSLWARSVCINENLELGSVIPFLSEGDFSNMDKIILNPNQRTDYNNEVKINNFNWLVDTIV